MELYVKIMLGRLKNTLTCISIRLFEWLFYIKRGFFIIFGKKIFEINYTSLINTFIKVGNDKLRTNKSIKQKKFNI
jgi:hypothetical protein